MRFALIFFTKILRYLLYTIVLQILGVICSSLIFMVLFPILSHDSSILQSFGWYLIFGFGLCLTVYCLRGLFVVVVLSALLRIHSKRLVPLLAVIWSSLVFYFFLHHIIRYDQRDRSLFIAAIIGYPLATALFHRWLSRRNPIENKSPVSSSSSSVP